MNIFYGDTLIIKSMQLIGERVFSTHLSLKLSTEQFAMLVLVYRGWVLSMPLHHCYFFWTFTPTSLTNSSAPVGKAFPQGSGKSQGFDSYAHQCQMNPIASSITVLCAHACSLGDRTWEIQVLRTNLIYSRIPVQIQQLWKCSGNAGRQKTSQVHETYALLFFLFIFLFCLNYQTMNFQFLLISFDNSSDHFKT